MSAQPSLHTKKFRHKEEFILAILLTHLAAEIVLVVLCKVFFYDTSTLKKQVDDFFQVELRQTDTQQAYTEYANDRAKKMANEIIDEKNRSLFESLPENLNETPRPLDLPKPAADNMPPPGVDKDIKPDIKPLEFARAEVDISRAIGAESGMSLIHLKKGASTNLRHIPNLKEHYGAGKIGGVLGRPGATLVAPKDLSMPPAPKGMALEAPAPMPTSFALPEGASLITRRMISERPQKGYPSLDEDIDAKFTVYRDEKSGETYFRLVLSLRDDSRVQPIPADVLFLVDISQSVSNRELAAVRDGICKAIPTLPRYSRWNIVTFSEQSYSMHENNSFAAKDAYDETAVREFVDRHAGQRRTNVFEATRLILSRIPQSNRPCNVFLISDGKATEGTSQISRIVRDFSRENRDNFSIFTFNAGEGGNAYLLSLLSYRSRGYRLNCPELEEVDERMASFAGRFTLPVLTNVVASYTNIKTEEVYPEVLPNLYRGQPVIFWGRTTPGKDVSLRVAGMGSKGPREFFFRTVVPRGDTNSPEVVRGWAWGKSHELMSRLGDEPDNEKLKEEITRLATEYKLTDVLEMIAEKKWRLPIKLNLPWQR